MTKELSGKFNNLALLLLILFVIGLLMSLTIKAGQIFSPGFQFDALTIQTKMFHTVFYIFQISVFVGSAIWLFIESKKNNQNPWLWSLLGLFAGVLGVILWFLFQIYKLLSKQQINEKP